MRPGAACSISRSARSGRASPASTCRWSCSAGRVATPLGPAAGPHTQLAQNLVIGWLAGARVARAQDRAGEGPARDPAALHRRARSRLQRGVVAGADARAIGVAVRHGVAPDPRPGRGRRGPAVPRAIPRRRSRSRSATTSRASARRRSRVSSTRWGTRAGCSPRYGSVCPPDCAARADVAVPARIADTVTLSTFHGCPPAEIEQIVEHLFARHRMNVVVKLQPDAARLRRRGRTPARPARLRRDRARSARRSRATSGWDDALALFARLEGAARRAGLALGVKLTNTLVVRNRRGVLAGRARLSVGPAAPPAGDHARGATRGRHGRAHPAVVQRRRRRGQLRRRGRVRLRPGHDVHRPAQAHGLSAAAALSQGARGRDGGRRRAHGGRVHPPAGGVRGRARGAAHEPGRVRRARGREPGLPGGRASPGDAAHRRADAARLRELQQLSPRVPERRVLLAPDRPGRARHVRTRRGWRGYRHHAGALRHARGEAVGRVRRPVQRVRQLRHVLPRERGTAARQATLLRIPRELRGRRGHGRHPARAGRRSAHRPTRGRGVPHRVGGRRGALLRRRVRGDARRGASRHGHASARASTRRRATACRCGPITPCASCAKPRCAR